MAKIYFWPCYGILRSIENPEQRDGLASKEFKQWLERLSESKFNTHYTWDILFEQFKKFKTIAG